MHSHVKSQRKVGEALTKATAMSSNTSALHRIVLIMIVQLVPIVFATKCKGVCQSVCCSSNATALLVCIGLSPYIPLFLMVHKHGLIDTQHVSMNTLSAVGPSL